MFFLLLGSVCFARVAARFAAGLLLLHRFLAQRQAGPWLISVVATAISRSGVHRFLQEFVGVRAQGIHDRGRPWRVP